MTPLPTAHCPLPTAHCPLSPARHIDPEAISGRAANGGFQKSQPGQGVGDAGVVKGLWRGFTAAAANGPFERAMKVGQGLVKALRMAAGKTQVGANRARQEAVIRTLPVQSDRLVDGVVLQDRKVGMRPGQGPGRANDPEAVVVLCPGGDL